MRIRQIAGSHSLSFTCVLGMFCTGVLIGPLFLFVPNSLLIICLTILGVMAISVQQKTRMFVAICLLALLLGMFRYQQSEIPPNIVTVADKVGVNVRVQGTVISEVEHKISSQQTILSDVKVANEIVFGKLLVRFPLFPKIGYGDTVVFMCRLDKPEPVNGFAYDRQLASKGVLAVCGYPEFVYVEQSKNHNVVWAVFTFKNLMVGRLQQILPEPHAAFVSGLLFGGSSSLSNQLREDFSKTGVSHILAASGFNVSLFSVVLLNMLLQSRLGRKRGLVVASVFLFLYVIAAGATPSVVRAGIMAVMFIVQTSIRRKALMTNIVLLTLSVMLLINPRLLLDDVGFQLSFAATCALLFALPMFKNWLKIIPETLSLRTSVASSSAAILFTLPILLWHFGTVSIVAPIVNAIVLPFVPFIMLLALVALVLGFVWMPLGQFLILPTWALSYDVLRVVSAFGSFEFASIPIKYSHTIAVLIAGGLLVWLICKRHEIARQASFANQPF